MPVSLVEYIARVLKYETIEDVWSAHKVKMREFGFDRLFYGNSRFRDEGAQSAYPEAFLLSSHDPSFLQAYYTEGLYQITPTVALTENQTARSWRRTFERFAEPDLSEGEARLRDLYAAFELRAGYTVSLPGTDRRSGGLIGLCARRGIGQDEVDMIWRERGSEIEMLCNLLHIKIATLPEAMGEMVLTQRQREVLQHVADGASASEIAEKLGISLSAVEKHLRLAREALSVRTTAQAVQKAIRLHQLYNDKVETAA